MKQTVIVKGNILKGTKGITVTFDPDVPFEQLCDDTAAKFRSLSGFLGQSDMAVVFEGRSFTAEEERILVNLISDNSQIGILFLSESDPSREMLLNNKLEEVIREAALSMAPAMPARAAVQSEAISEKNSFYCGTLRSGQMVNCKGNVVILGDVNPGGTVISDGSIIIMGALRGVARAGATGDKSAFVIALEMHPTQIFISEAFGKGAVTRKEVSHSRFPKLKRDDKSDKKDKGPGIPLIALYEDGGIILKQLNKETLTSLENAFK